MGGDAVGGGRLLQVLFMESVHVGIRLVTERIGFRSIEVFLHPLHRRKSARTNSELQWHTGCACRALNCDVRTPSELQRHAGCNCPAAGNGPGGRWSAATADPQEPLQKAARTILRPVPMPEAPTAQGCAAEAAAESKPSSAIGAATANGRRIGH